MGSTRIYIVSTEGRGRMAEVGGDEGWGVGTTTLSIGGLNFPAVWGVASGGLWWPEDIVVG